MALTKTPIELSSTPSIVDGGNATAITIDSSENVGIGTAPSSYAGYTSLTTSGTTGTTFEQNVGSTLTGTLTADSQVTLNAVTAVPLVFKTTNTERMRIDASGNVGIGCTPSYKLDVASTVQIRAGESLRLQNVAGSSAATIQCSGAGSNSDLGFSTANVERMRIDSSGNVGIGTSSPISFGANTAGLTVNGSSGSHITWQNNGTNVAFAYPSGNNFIIGSEQAGANTIFTAAGAERMRIDSSGRILINTTSPLSSSAAKLQVLQTVTDEWSQRIGNSAGSPYGLAIDYSSANPNNNVNFFIYCTSSNGAKFGVQSNGGISNYSGFNINLSDRNAKKDITIHTDNEWDCVKAWEIVDYRYKDEADDSPAKIGVIAQQIQEHCPDLVNVFQEQADAVEEVLGEDGEVVTEAKAAVEERIGVNEAQMMWKVTKALQEAMERIETLEAKVQTLENN